MATYLGGEQSFIELAKKHPQVLVSHSNICMFTATISICNSELQLKLELEATLHLSIWTGVLRFGVVELQFKGKDSHSDG